MKLPAPICVLAVFLFFPYVCPVNAQTGQAGDPPREIDGKPFRDYVNSQEYFDQLAKEAQTYEANLGSCATPGDVVRLHAGRPQFPSTFPKLGTPPQWMEVLKISGCDEPVKRAVLVLYVNSKLVFLPIVSGKALTRYDVILQKDVITTLMATERVLAVRAGCPENGAVRILDTRTVSKQDVEGGIDWREEWKLANCKGGKDVTISYKYRKGRGTRFTIEQAKAE